MEKSYDSGNHIPLEECLPYKVSASQGYPPVSGVHLTRVSILHRCLPSRDIIPVGVFFLQGFTTLYMAICFRKVSALYLSQLENKNVTAVYSHNYL